MDADQIDYSCEGILPDGKLPGDVMVSILSNFPVKSLLKFKAVCQSWRSLISSPVFIKMHLHRQSVIANNLIITWKNVMKDVTELSLFRHNYDMSEILPPWSSVEEGVYVFDSCKGLVCMGNSKYGIPEKNILWNPATRRYRSLELPNKPSCPHFIITGLGFVEATNDYKIVGLAHRHTPTSEQCLFVYTLSSDSWKELDFNFNNFPTFPAPPTFMNGCIHWLGDTCPGCPCIYECTCSSLVNVIFAFDVENEVMRCFGVPDNYDRRSILSRQILVIKGCLSVVTFPQCQYEVMESGIEIWAMLEYGVEGSWVKQFTIQGLTSTVAVPLRSWKGSEILFIYKLEEEVLQKMMSYEPCSKKKIFCEPDVLFTKSCRVFNYVESLAPVD